MEVEEETMNTAIVSKSMAVMACTAMSVVYVAILYAPTLILGLAPPTSYKQFMIRRFFSAALSSFLSLLVSSALLLPIQRWNMLNALALYGVRADHIWRTLVFPFSLTSLMYMGSLVKSILLLDSGKEDGSESTTFNYFCTAFLKMYDLMISFASNVTAWRNLVVAPITEEIVFRACMMPLLLCGGFKSQTAIFICPIFFSLAHLNHLLEFYMRKDCSLLKASVAIGTQLAYTMVFGSYASFLFVRTGHLVAPLVAHIVCNYMGLPALYSGRKGILVSLAFMAGSVAFFLLLFPLTDPTLYNTRTDNCRCWHGYCSWI